MEREQSRLGPKAVQRLEYRRPRQPSLFEFRQTNIGWEKQGGIRNRGLSRVRNVPLRDKEHGRQSSKSVDLRLIEFFIPAMGVNCAAWQEAIVGTTTCTARGKSSLSLSFRP